MIVNFVIGFWLLVCGQLSSVLFFCNFILRVYFFFFLLSFLFSRASFFLHLHPRSFFARAYTLLQLLALLTFLFIYLFFNKIIMYLKKSQLYQKPANFSLLTVSHSKYRNQLFVRLSSWLKLSTHLLIFL